ncbi:hypothetical protein ACE1OC_00095 [Streptomyces sp. DSM 116496]|uniref:terpene synthase family protein n=1 Tax=Streptomyces stoeckheimensis TaxID=3344656 RepID=UPI0038B3C2F0
MTSLELPDFVMPLPEYGASAAMADIEQDMWAWLERHGLIANESLREQLVRTRPQYTTALYYPRADVEHLKVINRFMAWAFIVDDLFDDSISAGDEDCVSAFSAELIGVARDDERPQSIAGRALREVLDALCLGRSQQWRLALAEANTAWLGTYPIEAQASREGRIMQFNAYAPHRRDGVGERIFFLMAEHVRDIELPSEVRDLPAMTQARERAIEWVGRSTTMSSRTRRRRPSATSTTWSK